MIQVTINSQSHNFDTEYTISRLLERMNIQKDGTAIAVNDRVIPRSEHGNFVISIGDRIEIIRAVGGG